MKSQSILILAVVVLLAGLAGGVYAGTYSGGTGEPNDPYRIATPNDLNDIGNHVEDFNKCFIMVNDINLADYNGTQFNIIGYFPNYPFTGVFDGNGHNISNFTYKSTSTNNVGLFRDVGGPNTVVKYVTLIDPNISAGPGDNVGSLVGSMLGGTIVGCRMQRGSVSGNHNIGGLVGYVDCGVISQCGTMCCVTGTGGVGALVGLNGEGTISDCYARGCVHGISHTGGLAGWNVVGDMSNCYSMASVVATHAFAGGLVGWNGKGTVSNCYATGAVDGNDVTGGLAGYNDDGTFSKCYATGSVSGSFCCGGLLGGNNTGVLANCYATGNVDGNNAVGGLVGNYLGLIHSGGPISYCYSTGYISGDCNVGGLVGYDNEAVHTECFWDNTVNPDVNGIGNANDPNVMGKSTAEMQTESTFTYAGWDFVEVWGIGENQTYPFLRVYPAGDLNHDGIVNFMDVAILAGHWLEGAGP